MELADKLKMTGQLSMNKYAKTAMSIRSKMKSVRERFSELDTMSYLYLLRVNTKGVKQVMRYSQATNSYTVINRLEAERLGVDIENLPDYYEFKEKEAFISQQLFSLFVAYRREQRAHYKELEDSEKLPLYLARRENYEAYLNSDEWQNKRAECVNHHGDKCLDCGNRYQDIHHLHYETLGFECPINDLVPLCKNCHATRHKTPMLNSPYHTTGVITQ